MGARQLQGGPLGLVLAKLTLVKEANGGWMARCPAHKDGTPSLSVNEGRDGRVVLNCFAGCKAPDIVRAIGLEMSDLFPPKAPSYAPPPPASSSKKQIAATYPYLAPDGSLLFEVVRYEPKGFAQRRPNGMGGWDYSLGDVEPVLYRLPDVLEAAGEERVIYVVEGEKDADTLAESGLTATTCPMGAGKWREHYSQALSGASIVILPDNDDAGRSHAEQVAASLTAQRCTVRLVTLPGAREKGDVTDWLDDGHDFDELQTLVDKAPLWVPDPSKRTRFRLDEIWADEEGMKPPPVLVPYLAWSGRSTLFASQEKAGKSTLLGYIVAEMSKGGSFLNECVQPGVALIIGLEEVRYDVARRLQLFDARPERVHIVDRLLSTSPSDRVQEIRDHIAAVRPTLVILDTLVAYGDATVTDWASSAQAAPIVNALTSIAHETGVAIILVHHAKKSDGRYRDSSAIGGAVDVIAEMQIPDVETDPTLRKLTVRGRLGNAACRFRYDRATYVVDQGDEAPLEYRIHAFIRDRVTCSVRDVIQGVRGKAETIHAAIGHMIADGRLVNSTPGRSHMTLSATDAMQAPIQWRDS